MTTIFEQLRTEHAKARTLLELVSKTKGDSDGRRELFARLCHELEDHAKAEERSLYQPMMDTTGQEKATHSIHEHEQIRELIAELHDMSFSSPGWISCFRKLRERVEHHMDEEEREVFQHAGRVLADRYKSAERHNAKRDEVAG